MPTPHNKSDNATPSAAWRRRFSRLLLLLFCWCVIPFLVLALLEGALRTAGYGRPTQLLFARDTPHGTAHSVNLSFYKQFLYVEEDTLGYAPHDVPIPVKGEDAYRVIVLGSSAALGWYFSDFAFSRYLEALLRAAYPEREIEVISLAWFGMNSHVMRMIAEQLPAMKPDAVVVYAGNNEMTGPFGLMSRLGARDLNERALDRAIRLHLALADLRLLQLLGDNARNMGFSAVGGMRWGLDAPVSSLDDPRIARVYRHYEYNLLRICDYATSAGAPVVLSTLLRNERDWRPRNSLVRAGWTPEQETRRQEKLLKAEGLADPAEARALIDAAVAMDPQHALTQFLAARKMLARSDYHSARAAFRKAWEFDATLDFATPQLNDVIRHVAGKRTESGVYLVDPAEDFGAFSPDGLVGNALLYDHIHLTREGNYRLALHIARAIAEELPEAEQPALAVAAPWLAFEEASRWLGDSRESLLDELRRARDSIRGMWPEQDTAWLDEQLAKVENGAAGAGLPASRAQGLVHGLQRNPTDFLLNYRITESGLYDPEYREAALHAAMRLPDLHPDYWRSGFARIQALQYHGDREGVLEQAQALAEAFPFFPESHLHLANAYGFAGNLDAALRILRRLARQFPRSDLPPLFEVSALSSAGRHQEAIPPALRSIANNPDNAGAYHGLDSILMSLRDPNERVRQWRDLAEAYPKQGHAHHFLSSALRDTGQEDAARDAAAHAANANPGRYGNAGT